MNHVSKIIIIIIKRIKTNKNSKKEKRVGSGRERETKREREKKSFFIFIFFASLFDIRSFDRRNLSGQERKFIYSTRATRGNQKHGISPRFQVKVRKILCFGFSQIYGVLTIRLGRTKS